MISCTHCSTPAEIHDINSGDVFQCSICGHRMRIQAFPAILKKEEKSQSPETLLIEDDAGCFYHPGKKAVSHCSSCGRFLCALCDVEMDGEHICFPCMEKGKKKKNMSDLENDRVLYDGIALRLSLLPFTLILYFTVIFSAPAALYMVFRHWNSPTSIIERSKIRFVFALVFSSIQIIGIITLIFFMVTAAPDISNSIDMPAAMPPQ